MRRAFADALLAAFRNSPFLFFTGDLGFMALEELRDAMGSFFVNAGVAEQNMVSAAAGAASQGIACWVYSIAPFVYARPFEQIRNDMCFHHLPVKLVGNGGGYGYGVMGPTHHALEDYGVLQTLRGMRTFVPAFREDIGAVIPRVLDYIGPAYLRLGSSEAPVSFPVPGYRPWRQLLDGNGPLAVFIGPIVGSVIADLAAAPEPHRPHVWVLSELPCLSDSIPGEFLNAVRAGKPLVVVEEHVQTGGAGQALLSALAEVNSLPADFRHLYARGYPSGRFGKQFYHRNDSGLGPCSILRALQP